MTRVNIFMDDLTEEKQKELREAIKQETKGESDEVSHEVYIQCDVYEGEIIYT